MVSGYHIRQYSSRLFSNLLYWHFLPLVPTSYSLPVSQVYMDSQSPPPPSPIYLTPRARIQHLLGFLSGLSIVTIEIWSVYQVSPHELIYIMCIHINGQTFTQVSLCWRMELWLCSFFSAWEKQKSPPHAGSLVAAGACDMDHLPPNTVTEAENSRCVLAIWI